MCNGQRPCQPWSFASQLEWLGANVFAWWENKYSGLFTCIPAANVAAFNVARLQEVVAAYPSKEVVLTEFGWPAGPDGYTEVNQFTGEHCGVASQANQDLVVGATVDELRRLNLPHVVFEMYREGWKTVEGPIGVWWGLQ